MTWYIWIVTYLLRNATIVRGTSYHLLGSRISWDSKIQFWLKVESYISDWQFSKLQHLASYVSHHNVIAYDRMWINVLLPKHWRFHRTSGEAPLEIHNLIHHNPWQPITNCRMCAERSVIEDSVEGNSWGESKCEYICGIPSTKRLYRASVDAPLESHNNTHNTKPSYCNLRKLQVSRRLLQEYIKI